MLGLLDLKPLIEITSARVECPVKGCGISVERQRRTFRRQGKFQCPEHEIYISPSSFQYACEADNLLWHRAIDEELLNEIKGVKRESRMARDNSEDALTWNIFRFLDISKHLAGLLSHVTQQQHTRADLVYWSYDPCLRSVWPKLSLARKEFGENIARGSEPDLIAITDTAIFFIESKFMASNDTSPSKSNDRKKYLSGGKEWYKKVFLSDYDIVSIKLKKYELMRFWLLGSWLAEEMNRDFYLLNVVPSKCETDIEERFVPHIKLESHRHFKRLAWEEIYSYIINDVPSSEDICRLSAYVQNKTFGYKSGVLQSAFSISNVLVESR